MEGKSRQNRIVNNRIPFERFVRLFAMIEIVLTFLYAKYFATFSVYGSRIWVLVIIVSILAVGSLVLSWKAERNWVSLISGTLMPVLVYEAMKYVEILCGDTNNSSCRVLRFGCRRILLGRKEREPDQAYSQQT